MRRVRPSISLLLLPDAKVNRKTVLKVNNFKEAFPKGSKGCLVSAWSTIAKSQGGIDLLATGLSLLKLANNLFNSRLFDTLHPSNPIHQQLLSYSQQ